MASSNETVSMALFCDFENVALGVRDAKYDKFDIKLVLERLLLKGSIVVKKAYCDWDRYKSFKGAMHEANFELIEIPHVRQSGKNSADIRLVVDALDLCYTKSHVNTFVIISGDSDFSPLVSKLRENAKQVIGVGVQQSTSDLLIANCDEFFFYDDLVRESQRAVAKRESSRQQKNVQPTAKPSPDEEKSRQKEDLEKRRTKAIEIAVQTFDALASERGDSGKIWASVLKNAIKRRKPDFNETYYGFRAFGNLLEEAHARGLLEFGRDEKSGAYVYRSAASSVIGDSAGELGAEQTGARTGAALDIVEEAEQLDESATVGTVGTDTAGKQDSRRRGRGDRKRGASQQAARSAARGTALQVAPKAEHEAAHASADEVAHEVALEGPQESPQEGAHEVPHEDRQEVAQSSAPETTSHAKTAARPSGEHSAAELTSPLTREMPMPAPQSEDRFSDAPQRSEARSSQASDDTGAPESTDAQRTDATNAMAATDAKRRKQPEPRKTAAKKSRKPAPAVSGDSAEAASPATQTSTMTEATPAPRKKAARKTDSSKARRSRKTAGANEAK
ncbi:NYN domain-containing protein [bacterium M00.F.Ca.ET.228.01.1.1]|uniref:NYN domain-containing protein n=1 Tax=Paraburkholderia phenoliruptrix TaxID=252970 RepID=UPI001092E049|nr:NYN domain-containing protein [Paraburkholderia phenoliruptrix]TGP44013.1 NYN domain-containing protein [bacterium M00.F.Ca.ET.228.01.1.1]TGS01676.1 NYN domain-containing protein [bacterium M00.F.Ca.ET.191.01.1.1]TGU08719.1 NYN domain-containing protein [bacterium M00.F.Ca.ET.155.01.1.1]MBW0450357.1 NYN domain-containing protein [Paraburkholderia phenoliruptrix]MBW9097318.1 NYN domain-containing protein [Paraburkholderia phenoliruptrix]